MLNFSIKGYFATAIGYIPMLTAFLMALVRDAFTGGEMD
jgi:hypothetical protein